MKICFLGDTHLDKKKFSEILHKYFRKFYSNIFFPYLIENDIKIVIQFGDLVDLKKEINFDSLDEIYKYFLSKFEKNDIVLHSLVGNHDTGNFKYNLKNNAQSIIFKHYKNFFYYDKPTTIQLNNIKFDIIPWIAKDNQKEIFEYIDRSESEYCLGHFELSGFEMQKGYTIQHGMERGILKKYDKVYSGHYHTSSEKANIKYLGVPYQLDWNDAEDEKGFYIFDTETRELQFIKNPYKLFNKIYYNENIDYNIQDYQDSYVKIIVTTQVNQEKLDRFVKQLQEVCYDVMTQEEYSINTETNEIEENKIVDTIEVLNTYVENIEEKKLDLDKVKNLLENLYLEALQEK